MTELPKGWAIAEIGDLLNGIKAGKNLKCVERPPAADEQGVIKVSAVTWGTFDALQSKTLPVSFKPDPDTTIQAGDFLFSRANTLELVGAVVMVKKDYPNLFLSDKILRLDFAHEFKPWLLQYLRGLEGRQKLSAASTGNQVSMRNIGQVALKAVSVPIPPLNEQRRIVAKIEAMFERIDKGVESMHAARGALGLYRQSLLKSAFEGRLTATWRSQNPDKLEPPKALLARIQKERETRYKSALDDWQTALSEWRANGEMDRKPGKPERPPDFKFETTSNENPWPACKVQALLRAPLINGRSVKTLAGGFRVLRLTALRNGRINLAENKEGSWTQGEAHPFLVEKDDIFLARGNGSKNLVGSAGRVLDEPTPVAFPDTMIRVRLDPNVISADFFLWIWNSRTGRSQIETAARTTAGIYKINQDHVSGFVFQLPTLAEQAEITRILDARLIAADAMEAEINAALLRGEALRQSILKQAFAGTLVPQDPTDEPAPTLLARIKAERAKAGKSKPRKTAHAG